MLKQSSEKELVEGCVSGDKKFQRLLYEMYARKMFGVCLRYCNDRDAAKDILQDGFVKVFSNISQYRFTGPLEAWIRRIMVNTALETFRSKMNNLTVDLEEASGELKYDEGFEKVSRDEILKLIQNLAPGYRTVFNMFAIEGYSHAEIAEMMGISESTSKSQLSRARVILQEEIKKIRS